MSIHVTITPNGRMSLPAAIRKRLGLSRGGSVVIEEIPDGVILRTTAQAVARAQAVSKMLTEGKPGASVNDFLADRRREWRED
jgi:AbrB family looped-hinge helix DNA binding protein